MHLITQDIAKTGSQLLTAFCNAYQVSPQRVFYVDEMLRQLPKSVHTEYSFAVDFGAAAWIAHRCQTFMFDVEQILAFLRSVDRVLPPGDYHAPFPHMCFQFSKGIDEKLFTTGLKPSGNIDEADEILGLVLSVPDREENDHYRLVNVVAWYKSTAINRVQIPIDSNGEIVYEPLNGDGGDERRRDKQRLANLAMLCLAYLTTPGMIIERVSTPEKVNRKRERDGKRRLPDYYICRWSVNRAHVAGDSASGTGTPHGFRYDVTGHFRRLPDGRTIWIRPHQRGVEHERYVPKVYRVE